MKKLMVLLLTLISVSNLKAQNNERIINDILFDLFGRHHKDTILIVREISKPVFDYDSATIEEKTGLKFPTEIINEWKKNLSSDESVTQWNEFELNNSNFKNYTLVGKKPIFKCLTKEEADLLIENEKLTQTIFTISKIVFDDKKENAIFRTYANGQGIFISQTILIKKIFEKWIIINKFDFMIK